MGLTSWFTGRHDASEELWGIGPSVPLSSSGVATGNCVSAVISTADRYPPSRDPAPARPTTGQLLNPDPGAAFSPSEHLQIVKEPFDGEMRRWPATPKRVVHN